jgi:hypothetical protein
VKPRRASKSPYSEEEVNSAIATLKGQTGSPSPNIKPRSRFSLARLSKKKSAKKDEDKKITQREIESW